jgi:hypothetical protein
MNNPLAEAPMQEPLRRLAEPDNTHEAADIAALRTALKAVEQAEASASSQALCHAWLRVGRCWRVLHSPDEAHNSLRHALREARTTRRAHELVQVLCEMAENTCDLADVQPEPSSEWLRMSRDKARDEVFEASSWLLRGGASADAAHTLLRLSDVLNRCGDHDDATVLQARALGWMASCPAEH